MVRFQQQLSFDKTLSVTQLTKILIDPTLIIGLLYLLAVIIDGKLYSHYIVLSILTFTISFPGSWRGAQHIKQELLSTFQQWFLIVAVLLFFGYATDYLAIFTQCVIVTWILLTPFALLTAHWLINQYLLSQHYISQVKKTAITITILSFHTYILFQLLNS